MKKKLDKLNNQNEKLINMFKKKENVMKNEI